MGRSGAGLAMTEDDRRLRRACLHSSFRARNLLASAAFWIAKPGDRGAHGIGGRAHEWHHERIVHARWTDHSDRSSRFATLFPVRSRDEADREADHGFG